MTEEEPQECPYMNCCVNACCCCLSICDTKEQLKEADFSECLEFKEHEKV